MKLAWRFVIAGVGGAAICAVLEYAYGQTGFLVGLVFSAIFGFFYGRGIE